MPGEDDPGVTTTTAARAATTRSQTGRPVPAVPAGRPARDGSRRHGRRPVAATACCRRRHRSRTTPHAGRPPARCANSPAERDFIAALLAPSLGVPPSRCRRWRACSSARCYRGAEVTLSSEGLRRAAGQDDRLRGGHRHATALLGLTIANIDLGEHHRLHGPVHRRHRLQRRRRRPHRRRPGRPGRGHRHRRPQAGRGRRSTSTAASKLPAHVTARSSTATWSASATSRSTQGAGGDPNAVLRARRRRSRWSAPSPRSTSPCCSTGSSRCSRRCDPKDVNKLSYEIIQVLQGEGGTIDSLLAHTASLTTTIAGKDEVIGQVIDNLNAVLDTVNARGDQAVRADRPAAAAGLRARRGPRADRRRDRARSAT